MSYEWEKFHSATRILATGKGSIKERLVDAFIYELHIIEPDDAKLPHGLKEVFSKIFCEVTSAKPVGDEGTIIASIKTMSEERAIQIAEEIFDIFVELSNQL